MVFVIFLGVKMDDKIIGRNPVLEAIKAGRSIDKILIKKGKYASNIIPVIKQAKAAGIVIQEVDKTKLDAIAEGENHQGIIAYELFTGVTLPDDMADKIKKEVFGR